MSAPSQVTIGAFVVGVAKLAEHGDLIYEGGKPNGFSDVYYVVMADRATRPTTANVEGLPTFGAAADDTDTDARTLRVSKIVFSQVAPDSRVWKITVTYELKSNSENSGGEGEDEKDIRNFKVTFGVAEDSADVSTDVKTGSLIVNSAGDPFDSVPQKRTFGSAISVEFDTASFPSGDYLLNGHVNDASFAIGGMSFEPHALMLLVEVTDSNDPDHRWHCTYTFTQKVNVVRAPVGSTDGGGNSVLDIGWDVAFAECGFQYKDPADNDAKKKFLVPDGNGGQREPSLPMPLDENGHPAEEPACRRVRVYPSADFSNLSIPIINVGA